MERAALGDGKLPATGGVQEDGHTLLTRGVGGGGLRGRKNLNQVVGLR